MEQLLPQLTQLVITVFLGVLTTLAAFLLAWLPKYLEAKTGVKIAEQNTTLGMNLEGGILNALQAADKLSTGDKTVFAVDYVAQRFPDTMEKLGLTKAMLPAMIAARMVRR